MSIKLISLTILTLLLFLLACYLLFLSPLNRNKNLQVQSNISPTTNLSPTQMVIRTRSTCTTDEDCKSMFAMNIATAVTAIRIKEGNPKLEVKPKEDTLKKQVTIYCDNKNKCWSFDNKLGKLVN